MTIAEDGHLGRCFQVKLEDNVATLLDDVGVGSVAIHGASGQKSIQAVQPIALGHKIALAFVPAGAFILKYGVPIGIATGDIHPGEWVHLHNCRSQVDERSNNFEIPRGAAPDDK